MHFRVLLVSMLAIGSITSNIWALAGTKGTPIGGMGTGYVIYDARTGDFATSSKTPPAGWEGDEFLYNKSIGSGFHLFAGGQAVQKAKTPTEDAKCPLYTADFGAVNGVNFSLNACGPFIPGDNPLNYQLATSPVALFEIIARNDGAAEIEIAVAMEFTNASGSRNLLGGANNAVIDPASGNKAISFPPSDNTSNAYLTAGCDNAAAVYSAGALGTFLTTGTLSNTDGNCVAAKCTIAPGTSVRIKFMLSWWRTFVSAMDRYAKGSPDDDGYYYHNFYTDSKAVSDFVMPYFDQLMTSTLLMVNRVMGSNFPYEYKERLLNNLYPLIHNSICTRDGRTAFWEGLYPIIGTIDQAQHASLWYSFNWPKNQWQEMQYWLRTAHTGVGEDVGLKGQVHHDFNMGPAAWTDDAHFMCPWDNYLREDYFWCKNTTEWSDLNTMAIFKLYELMCATGDLDSMKVYFPKLIPTADRLLFVCNAIGKHLPTKSKSTYDTEGHDTPQYASGIALVAYLAMEEMAKFVGDAATAQKYRDWYTIARAEFKTDIFNSSFCSGRNYAEGDIAGYSWGNYFCLEPVMDADVINEGCRRLWQLYSFESSLQNKLGRWHFYTCDHWGGAEIARGCPDTAMIMIGWDYEYYHKQAPTYVFWQDLWENHDVYASYMTAPCAWRSYFQMTGYFIDNANKRLWIRPRIPTSMEKKIVNAPLLNTKCWGTLHYDEQGDAAKQLTQSMFIQYDAPVTINELILKNNTGNPATPYVVIHHGTTGKIEPAAITPQDWGLEQNIRVSFTEPVLIGPEGISVEVYKEQVGTVTPYNKVQRSPLAILTKSIRSGKPISYSIDKTGMVTIELISLSGAKIGTILNQANQSSGAHTFMWDGKTLDGKKISPTIAILRLRSLSGTVSQLVHTELK